MQLCHCAPPSHCSQPFHVIEKWTPRVMEEFFAQGDREKELGIVPIAMHDRERASAAQSQVGFIEFVVGPLCASFIRMFPPLASLGMHLVEVCAWRCACARCLLRLRWIQTHCHTRVLLTEPCAIRPHVAGISARGKASRRDDKGR